MQAWDPNYIWTGDPQNTENDLAGSYRAIHWNCEPVIQVICSSAVVMFRKGGPEEVECAEESGLRVKTLRKALVSLRWGKQRAVPPKPDDGYLELEEVLQTYVKQEQEEVDRQLRSEIQYQEERAEDESRCVMM